MAKTPWWAKIGAGYYASHTPDDPNDEERPSPMRDSVAARSREMAAVIASTTLRDQPQIAAAFLNSNVPLSIARRADAEFKLVKNRQVVGQAQQQGTTPALTREQLDMAEAEKRQRAYDEGGWDAFGQFNADIWNTLTDPIPGAIQTVVGGTVNELKQIPSRTLQGINALISPIVVPFSAGRANQAAPDRADTPEEWQALMDEQDRLRQRFSNSLTEGDWPTGGGAQDLTAEFPLTKGVRSLIGADELTPTQQQDMTRAGYDPNSFFSRYAWYYDAMEAGQRAVADSDIRYFEQEYPARDVQSVREIITSNYLNDGQPGGLSPESIEFLMRANSGDAQANELFERMAKSSTLHIGSVAADILGIPRGTEGSSLVSALGDLAIYWVSDPVALGSRAASAYRLRNYGFTPGDVAQMEERYLALRDPNNPASLPEYQAGVRLRQALADVEDIVRLRDRYDDIVANPATQAAVRAQGIDPEKLTARLASDQSNAFERFRRLHPDMVEHFELFAALRTGNLEGLMPRSIDDAIAAAKKAGVPRPFNPIRPFDKPGQPAWQLVENPNGKGYTQESLNNAASEVVDRLSLWLWADAVGRGLPLNRGYALLPGEIAVNRAFRQAVQPIRDALISPLNPNVARSTTLYNAIVGGRRGRAVTFDQGMGGLSDQIIGTQMGTWAKANITERWGRRFELAMARLEMSPSGRLITFTGTGSLESYTRFVVQFFGQRLGFVMANKWALAGPGERMAQWRQTVDGIFAAGRFRAGRATDELRDALLKGVVPARGSGASSAHSWEIYTPIKADNEINAGGNKIAAGIYSYQMSDGVRIPNFRAMRQMQERMGLLQALTGIFNSRIVAVHTQLWKSAKVSTGANMSRQGLESAATSTAEMGPRHLLSILNARRGLAYETVSGRVAANAQARASYKLADALSRNLDDINQLRTAFASGSNLAYVTEIDRIAAAHGLSAAERTSLGEIARQGVWFDDVTRVGGISRGRLNALYTVDIVRNIRLALARRLGADDAGKLTSPHHAHLDEQAIRELSQPHLNQLAGSADNYLLLDGKTALDDVAEGAAKGLGGRPVRVPNARELVGTGGDVGARRWFDEFDSRQTDDIGGTVLRAIAFEQRGLNPAAAINAERRAQGFPDLFPPNVNTPHEIAAFLIGEDGAGILLRNFSQRLMYNDDLGGTLVQGTLQQAAAVNRHAEVMIRDLAHHLGGRVANGVPVIGPEYKAVVDKLVAGERITLPDLAAIPDGARPVDVSAALYVPDVGKGPRGGYTGVLGNMASKAYQFAVARPLTRLVIQPTFIANKNIALRSMEPVYDALLARGLQPTQVSQIMEYTANRYAVNATFRGTDNAFERSVFSELTENFLMFQRAAEDFVRRFMRVTSANPQVVSRSFLLLEAAQHSGLVYPYSETNDDGSKEYHLVFAYPGSDLMMRAMQEMGQALGWGDDGGMKPFYSSLTSQVRFINPALSNPLGFSTSPIIGTPLRWIRSIWPETDRSITDILTVIEGGGEPHFAEQGFWQSWAPGPLNRLFPLVDRGNMDNQLASSVRNGMIYYWAAGLMPGPNASPDERQQARDAIEQMAMNQLLWRGITGAFLPAAPQQGEPEGLGLPEVNAIDMAMGINSIRGEWFEVLGDAYEKYGNTPTAFAEANIEWFRRHPKGESILNPEAFQPGTTEAPGTAQESGSFTSGPLASEWIVNNADWVTDNRAVAYYLIPHFQESNYSPAGMRQQLRMGLREHKDYEEFYNDIAYQIGAREFYDRRKMRDAQLAQGYSSAQVWAQWDDFERGWKAANPVIDALMRERSNPDYVHAELAPALQRVVESPTPPPVGVDLALARRVWEHYRQYHDQYIQTDTGGKARWDRARLNKEYRQTGDQMFLGTPAEDLWRAMDVYEVN